MNGLHITAPPDNPNTDGMHISKSETVRVSKSVIRTGDDCISVEQGEIKDTVNKVTCGPGHGISVGSLGKLPDELDVRGVIVKNCTLVGTTNGIRIYDNAPKLGYIIINQNYGTKSTNPSLVKISDVIYQDMKGTGTSTLAVSLNCSPRAPFENVSLWTINLKPKVNNLRLTSICLHAKDGFVGVQFPPPCPH